MKKKATLLLLFWFAVVNWKDYSITVDYLPVPTPVTVPAVPDSAVCCPAYSNSMGYISGINETKPNLAAKPVVCTTCRHNDTCPKPPELYYQQSKRAGK